MQGRSGPEQRYSVQILRAIAASTVVYLHTFTPPSFGLFGVDLFFLISGFVMCLVIDHKEPSPGAFMIDRVTRIVPLYWAVTTMVLLVAWLAPSVMGTTVANVPHYLLSLMFIPHFRDDGQLFPMLMPGWSLNYEMLYYAIIAMVLVLDRRHYKRPLALALIAVYALSNGAWLDPSSASGQFLHQTLWLEFVLGIGCYQIHRHRLLERLPKSVALVGAVLAYVAMVRFEGTADRLFTAGIPSFFMLLFSLQLEGAIRRLDAAALRFIVHIGDASYATYLSHMFVIGFVERIVFARLHIDKNTATALFTLACCLAVGSLLYRLVDKPLMRLARQLARWLFDRQAVPEARRSGSRP
ncbi:acyltransferase [Variovorax sp.]|uniref:acyltransferase family protein n=1 Tax=Variovorax sp. TaxID=1871043 RepID=UPI002D2C8B5C|nr:acyltransferase [Variovorax sp.]HYP83644.1 acyltransferase [Variovorax sp.]